MRKRHPNPRRVKLYRTYTVEETARLFAIHRNTVRQWIKAGLPTINDKRPHLLVGHELIVFLRARRAKNKKTCLPGEIYCVRCRAPKFPAAGMADFASVTQKVGNLTGICPDCHSIINRRVSTAKLGQVLGNMEVTFPQAMRRLSEISQPSVNSDLGQEASTDEGTQPQK